ncbi:AMP-binding protein [Nevskia sp.]|uniref:AMP-binding protein n=1 Tax=Nevskia sp. TaxID=1929292 RepID=UPI0025E26466|nr:AMP-binding protein [Nevskia sp.]
MAQSLSPVAPDSMPLARVYRWEKELADQPWLTQPMGQGQVRTWTWGEAVNESRRIAGWLQAQGRIQGWDKDAKVAILSKNCAYWIMADIAIWMAGYVSVPLYPTLTANSVRQILEHSEARAIFVGKLDDYAVMRPGIPDKVLRFGCVLSPEDDHRQWGDIVASNPPMTDETRRDPDELATIIYTSGTTGMPKGVMHSFATVARAPITMEQRINPTAADRVLSYLPLSHIAERWTVESVSIRCGMQIFFAETQETFLKDLQRARPTLFVSVPRLWVKFQQGVFAKAPKQKLDRLFRIPFLGRMVKKKILTQLGFDTVRFAGGGAAPMPGSLIEWYGKLGLELLEGYGMSENFGVSHGSKPGEGRPGYVGVPYDGVDHRIADSGEILVRSHCNMIGYFKEPEKTREALTEDGWLHTGDRGEIDAQNRLRITGRVKELFKTGKGKYVAPAPIESRLQANSSVEAVCVTGSGFPQPFAIVILSPEATAAFAKPELRVALSSSLTATMRAANEQTDPHEHLTHIVVVPGSWTVENGFITPTLKIKRNAVEDAYTPFFEDWARRRSGVVWHDAA